MEQLFLDLVQHLADGIGDSIHRHRLLGTPTSPHQHRLARRHIPRADLQPHRHAPQLPLIELPPRRVGVTVVQLYPKARA